MDPQYTNASKRRQQMLPTNSFESWSQASNWSRRTGWKHSEIDGNLLALPRTLPPVPSVSISASGSGSGSASNMMLAASSFDSKSASEMNRSASQTATGDRTWTFVAASSSQWHSPIESMTTSSSSPNDIADDLPYMASSVPLFPSDDTADLHNRVTATNPWSWSIMPPGQTLFGEVIFPVQPNSSAADQGSGMSFLPFGMPKADYVDQQMSQPLAAPVAQPVAVPEGSLTINGGLGKMGSMPEASSSRSRLLAPKSASSPSDRPVFQPHYTHIVAEDGTSKRVGAIAKSAYVRPKYPRKMCQLCSEHPDGFRGDHELRRHMDRAHKTVRKMWVCVNASDNPKFLSGCKHCRNGKKYGAYYNAAAHLRRQHFNPRPSHGRGRNAVKNEERRGGKGGGDNPPMEVLKHYMKEVDEVVVPESDEDDGDSCDGGNDKLLDHATQNEDANKSVVLPHQDPFDIGASAYDFDDIAAGL